MISLTGHEGFLQRRRIHPTMGEVASGALLDPDHSPAVTTSRATAWSKLTYSSSFSTVGQCQWFTLAPKQ
jgi:hypothetical protein